MISEEGGVGSAREGWLDEGFGSDTDIEALMTASDEEEDEEDEDEDENKMGKNGKRERTSR